MVDFSDRSLGTRGCALVPGAALFIMILFLAAAAVRQPLLLSRARRRRGPRPGLPVTVDLPVALATAEAATSGQAFGLWDGPSGSTLQKHGPPHDPGARSGHWRAQAHPPRAGGARAELRVTRPRAGSDALRQAHRGQHDATASGTSPRAGLTLRLQPRAGSCVCVCSHRFAVQIAASLSNAHAKGICSA